MSGHAASAEATSFGGSEGSGHGNAAIVVEDAVDRRGSHAPARSSSLDNILREKTITPIGGIALLFNNMTGIGLTQTSQTYQHSGWVVTTIFFVVYMVISTLCALFIVEAMQGIPGNKYFQGTVEFGTLINFYFGPTAHIFGQICLFGALQGNAVASIIQSAQTVDNLLVDVFGKTCAVFSSTHVDMRYREAGVSFSFEI
ncbi:hypothetical protein BC829DRAFT_80099 [Chytridium lagenaria]|nr:hypothetical protein BC829DRAFT_80099 [Chytridium lagenaria]